jgi:sulfide:quinone oxidoreductase
MLPDRQSRRLILTASRSDKVPPMQQITIVGSSFAALTAAQTLRESGEQLDISLVSPRPEFVYLPGVIWIPPGIRQGDDLRLSLKNFFRRLRINHVAAQATGLKDGGRTLVTSGGEIRNTGLIIACGGRFLKKLPGIEHAITPCEGIAAAEQIRDRLRAMDGGRIAMGFAANPNEPTAVRGGPMFEFLFGIDRQLRREQRRERFQISFFSPAPQPGNRLGPKAVQGLLKEMAKRDIATHLGHKLKGFTPSQVLTEGGNLDADLILFMPGLTGPEWLDATDLPRSPGGLIQADNLCRVPGFERVYVAGDAGSFQGPDWMPKQAHMADLQAEAAAANLVAELRGQEPRRSFPVELMCILDSGDSGMLVARTERHNLMLPDLRLLHWTKRLFEWWYLRRYR